MQSEKLADQYHLEIFWSEEDQVWIGLCPDLFFGGTHGDDPETVLRALRNLVHEEVRQRIASGQELPAVA